MNTPVSFRPPEIASPKSLRGYSGASATPPIPAGIPHGTEVVLGSVQCPRIGCPVLEDLYYDGDSTGSGYLHFRVTANGQTLPYDFCDGYTAVGVAGQPRNMGLQIPAGALIEIRCKNEHPSDDTLHAYCDGTVGFYEKPI